MNGVHVNTILSSPCSLSWSKSRGRWAPAVSCVEQEGMGAEPQQSSLGLYYAGQEAHVSSSGTTIHLPLPLIQSKGFPEQKLQVTADITVLSSPACVSVLTSSPETEAVTLLLRWKSVNFTLPSTTLLLWDTKYFKQRLVVTEPHWNTVHKWRAFPLKPAPRQVFKVCTSCSLSANNRAFTIRWL